MAATDDIDSAECQICAERYDDEDCLPKRLPCSHVLCVVCARSVIRKGILRCPFCNTQHKIPNADNLPMDTAAREMSRSISHLKCRDCSSTSSLMKCPTCAHQTCGSCVRLHKTRDHCRLLLKYKEFEDVVNPERLTQAKEAKAKLDDEFPSPQKIKLQVERSSNQIMTSLRARRQVTLEIISEVEEKKQRLDNFISNGDFVQSRKEMMVKDYVNVERLGRECDQKRDWLKQCIDDTEVKPFVVNFDCREILDALERFGIIDAIALPPPMSERPPLPQPPEIESPNCKNKERPTMAPKPSLKDSSSAVHKEQPPGSINNQMAADYSCLELPTSSGSSSVEFGHSADDTIYDIPTSKPPITNGSPSAVPDDTLTVTSDALQSFLQAPENSVTPSEEFNWSTDDNVYDLPPPPMSLSPGHSSDIPDRNLAAAADPHGELQIPEATTNSANSFEEFGPSAVASDHKTATSSSVESLSEVPDDIQRTDLQRGSSKSGNEVAPLLDQTGVSVIDHHSSDGPNPDREPLSDATHSASRSRSPSPGSPPEVPDRTQLMLPTDGGDMSSNSTPPGTPPDVPDRSLLLDEFQELERKKDKMLTEPAWRLSGSSAPGTPPEVPDRSQLLEADGISPQEDPQSAQMTVAPANNSGEKSPVVTHAIQSGQSEDLEPASSSALVHELERRFTVQDDHSSKVRDLKRRQTAPAKTTPMAVPATLYSTIRDFRNPDEDEDEDVDSRFAGHEFKAGSRQKFWSHIKALDICPMSDLLYMADQSPQERCRIVIFDPNMQFCKLGEFKVKGVVSSIAVISEHEIAMTDYKNHCVRIYTTGGEEIRSFGSEGDGNREFSDPCGIAHFNGRLFIADCDNDRICIWTVAGKLCSPIEHDQLKMPVSIAINERGDVFVSTSLQSQILVFAHNGSHKTTFSACGKYELPAVWLLGTDNDSNFFVAGRDRYTDEAIVDTFDPGYRHKKRLQAEFKGADETITGIAITNNGDIVLAATTWDKSSRLAILEM